MNQYRGSTMTIRTTMAAATILAVLASTTATMAQDWRQNMPVFRVGLLCGENEADRLRNNECFKTAMEERLGVPVEMFPAPDYAGEMQGLLAGPQVIMPRCSCAPTAASKIWTAWQASALPMPIRIRRRDICSRAVNSSRSGSMTRNTSRALDLAAAMNRLLSRF